MSENKKMNWTDFLEANPSMTFCENNNDVKECLGEVICDLITELLRRRDQVDELREALNREVMRRREIEREYKEYVEWRD